MTQTWFENIRNNLTYMNKKPPEFRDWLWEVRDMLDCWNSNMANNFILSWINCINESMSKWVNKYTCPGFMFVPCAKLFLGKTISSKVIITQRKGHLSVELCNFVVSWSG